jgi:hypothetical protein
LPAENINPVTDAILSVIGEYRSLTKDSARKKAPLVAPRPKRKQGMLQAFMENNRLRPSRNRGRGREPFRTADTEEIT